MYIVSSGRNTQHTDIKASTAKRLEAREDAVRKIRQEYIEVLLADPCLPKELLPADWPAEKARRAVKKLQHLVET